MKLTEIYLPSGVSHPHSRGKTHLSPSRIFPSGQTQVSTSSISSQVTGFSLLAHVGGQAGPEAVYTISTGQGAAIENIQCGVNTACS